MAFDFDATLRWLKPAKKATPLVRRPDSSLVWIDALSGAGAPLLPDTTVYIDVLQGRSPSKLDDLLTLRTINHSAVSVAELTHVFGRLDPGDTRTKAVLASLQSVIADIPVHRLHAPDADIWAAAGVLAGLLFRLGGYPAGQESKCLNDALLFLQARKLGSILISRNVNDMDLLSQLVPDGRVVLYRSIP